MDKWIRYIESILGKSISENLKNALYEYAHIEVYPKSYLLLRESKICHRMYFINSGTVRTFYYHNDKEVTSWVYNENQLLCSWHSFILQKPSFENVEINEDAEIASLSFSQIQELLNNYPQFERYNRIALEQQLAFLDEYYKGYMFLSAKEKYENLIAYFPDIEQRVNLGHIASLLGISQETLSRLRGKKK